MAETGGSDLWSSKRVKEGTMINPFAFEDDDEIDDEKAICQICCGKFLYLVFVWGLLCTGIPILVAKISRTNIFGLGGISTTRESEYI